MARDPSEMDLAARAAWLSFVGGMTQDQIAADLGISRQRAQRLVARASAEGLVRVRIAHRIDACLRLEAELKRRYGLEAAWVSPSAGAGVEPLVGLAPFAAPLIERLFEPAERQTVAVGTGRTLRMVVENLRHLDAAQHRLVAMNGNVAPDGSATAFEVIVRMAEKTSAPHFQLAIPVVARTEAEYALYLSLPHVKASRALAESADVAIVGIGQMADDAPLFVDGFITAAELAELQAAGAAGEIAGHIFDDEGVYLAHPVNDRIMGLRVPVPDMRVICIGCGPTKIRALHGALRGRLFTTLVTDETTAAALLAE